MINLIPPKGRVALKHEYILRVASVYGFLLAGVFLASTALMVPTYVLTSSQLTGARDEGDRMSETKKKFDEAFGEIEIANTVMGQLRTESNSVEITKLIEEVVRIAPRGIGFTTFRAIRKEGVLTEIEVQGTSESRIALASFKNELEASSQFKEALVPISDLARDTELTFVITVTLEGVQEQTPS